jgi:two-component system OmpR family response regulator
VRVLLVEDSERVARVISRALTGSGHLVEVARDCASARAELERACPELAIIDVGLPDGSGLDVCRAARSDGHDLPILVLTARNGVEDRVKGLDAGADDYLGKPFAVSELVARVRALGRRGPRWTDSVRTFGDVTVDRDRRTVLVRGEAVPLTPREFEIVAALAWRNGRVVPREELLEMLWGDASDRASASLDVLVTRIRRKISSPTGQETIRTLRHVGYAWALAPSKPV